MHPRRRTTLNPKSQLPELDQLRTRWEYRKNTFALSRTSWATVENTSWSSMVELTLDWKEEKRQDSWNIHYAESPLADTRMIWSPRIFQLERVQRKSPMLTENNLSWSRMNKLIIPDRITQSCQSTKFELSELMLMIVQRFTPEMESRDDRAWSAMTSKYHSYLIEISFFSKRPSHLKKTFSLYRTLSSPVEWNGTQKQFLFHFKVQHNGNPYLQTISV